MESQINNIEALFVNASGYIETRIDLMRLKAIDKSSETLSSLAAGLVLMVVGFSIFMLVNIGAALLIGDALGKLSYGFFIVAGFYFIVGIVLFLLKDKWLKMPIKNSIVNKLHN